MCMEPRFLMHRIRNEWQTGDVLLGQGYLSIGWNGMDEDVVGFVRNGQWQEFDEAIRVFSGGELLRNRGCLWRFLELEPGDYVVVPHVNKEFSIFLVEEGAMPVSKLVLPEDICNKAGQKFWVTDEGIKEEEREGAIDIGFVIKGKVVNRIPKSYAKARLVSRMKARQTNVGANDLKDEILAAKELREEPDFHRELLDAGKASVLKVLREQAPDQMEAIVRWYMEKIGADEVYKPASHGKNKMEVSDADVVGEFYNLNLTVFVQVKRHEGVTNDWAVNQVSKYSEYNSERNDVNYISWVISTADSFSEAAIHSAEDAGVRLIDGREFAEMLLECGFRGARNK